MSNLIEYDDNIAVHPGYYIKELIEDSGLTQEDYAKRLGTTPKNLSILVRGEQSLSIEIATRLSRMLGTTVAYWLKLQQAFDEKKAEFLSEEELKKEREVMGYIDYNYFTTYFDFPNISEIDERIRLLREFLTVSSLAVLKERNLAVSFRQCKDNLSVENVVNANVMVQIAINMALKTETGKYNKKRFIKEIDNVLDIRKNHVWEYDKLKSILAEAGVVLVVLPNLRNACISGATKRVDGRVVVMINEGDGNREHSWFTLFHEIGHVLNGDLGISFDGEAEDEADSFARKVLNE